MRGRRGRVLLERLLLLPRVEGERVLLLLRVLHRLEGDAMSLMRPSPVLLFLSCSVLRPFSCFFSCSVPYSSSASAACWANLRAKRAPQTCSIDCRHRRAPGFLSEGARLGLVWFPAPQHRVPPRGRRQHAAPCRRPVPIGAPPSPPPPLSLRPCLACLLLRSVSCSQTYNQGWGRRLPPSAQLLSTSRCARQNGGGRPLAPTHPRPPSPSPFVS